MEPSYCPCCLQPSLAMKFDVKGRPYAICASCGMRLFPRALNHIATLRYLSPLLQQIAAEVNDPTSNEGAAYRSSCTTFLRSLAAPSRNDSTTHATPALAHKEAANG
jgi:hypothetical protein